MTRPSKAKSGVTRAINDILGGLDPSEADLAELIESGTLEGWSRRLAEEHRGFLRVWGYLNPKVDVSLPVHAAYRQ